MSRPCAVAGCEEPRTDGSYCSKHGPTEPRPSVAKSFSEASGCGMALVVLIAALLVGFVIMAVRAVIG